MGKYTRENMLEFAKNNLELIFNKMGRREQGSFLGNIAEIYTVLDRPNAEEAGNEDGYDMLENDVRKEIKTCWSHSKQNGYAIWYNISSKQNKCDYFVFVDGAVNKVYEVPHDVVFLEMSINPRANGHDSLATTKHNMEILLRYELSVT